VQQASKPCFQVKYFDGWFNWPYVNTVALSKSPFAKKFSVPAHGVKGIPCEVPNLWWKTGRKYSTVCSGTFGNFPSQPIVCTCIGLGMIPSWAWHMALDQCSCCLQCCVLVLADVDNPTESSAKLREKTVAGPVRMVFVNFYSRNSTRAQDPGLAPLEKRLDSRTAQELKILACLHLKRSWTEYLKTWLSKTIRWLLFRSKWSRPFSTWGI